jgi:hypothetical protein
MTFIERNFRNEHVLFIIRIKTFFCHGNVFETHLRVQAEAVVSCAVVLHAAVF